MRIVIQRVNHASVKVDGETIGSIGKGYLLLLGVAEGDTKEMVDRYVKKLSTLRIFADEEGKTNLSITDVGGVIISPCCGTCSIDLSLMLHEIAYEKKPQGVGRHDAVGCRQSIR